MLQKMREKGIRISLILTVINFVPGLIGALIGSDAALAFFLIAMLVMGIIILIFLVLYFGKEIFGILNNMIPFALETGWGFGSELGAFLGDIPLVGALCAFFFQLLGGLIGVAIMLEFCVLLPILLSLWLPIVPVLLHKKGII